ncbi:dTDP-4-dehydrorhamnose 3,5-epimerase [Fodinibius sediminis]|uniref:dTDP-4-dehydrorhamnose 3,5-epimerase n=1 Tax=Fodinibius sediminis TaxID=1214077 RepID=A0A521BXV6_9BACT|nr:dTDP-4-dehydrorhamnose 3,5-epimerase [Fodinibius sediminis]SMO51300.1 dTDP-4-dehydrorhamnose 3,5-epimerase [Fodinibius sediminis]
MNITPTNIPDVLLLEPKVYEDERGFFLETYREEHLRSRGIDVHFVQDNLSKSQKNTVRGLHYQIDQQQDKLLMVMQGTILDVAVDLRADSSSFGEYTAVKLTGENKHQLFIPKGFAHGFSVLSEEALVYYKCSAYYYPEGERGLRWNDPELDIDWQVEDPIVSEKDQQQPLLDEISKEDLFYG